MNGLETAQALVEEAIILLKNQNDLLPLAAGTRCAVFGRAQVKPVLSGNGSGAAHGAEGKDLLTALCDAGLEVDENLAEFYRSQAEQEQKSEDPFDFSKIGEFVNSGLMYEFFGKYNPPVPEYAVPQALAEAAADRTDTAILILGRSSGGEECDRHLDGDYYLTDSEQALVQLVCSRFPRVALVLNINGLVDLSWVEKTPQIQSILFLGVPGCQGGPALANVIMGYVNPSGKLGFTIPKRFEDHPAARDFTWKKEDDSAILTYDSYGLDADANGSHGFRLSPVTVYREDIYAGYRYFDALGIAPLYPFGFGLSYTEFRWKTVSVNWNDSAVSVTVRVKNEGSCAGRDVVQLYLAARTEQFRPDRILVGFEKTDLLEPGQNQDIVITVPWTELAAYDEDTAQFALGAGEYLLLVGESSRALSAAANVIVPERIVTEQCRNRLGLQPCNAGKLQFMTPPPARGINSHNAPWEIILTKAEPLKISRPAPAKLPEGLTDLQLAALCVGYGPGIPFAPFLNEKLPNTAAAPDGTPVTVNSHPAGFNGYVSPAIPDKGILSVFYKDGPAGVGGIAWPSEMLTACAFSKRLWYAFGDAVGAECRAQQVDVWLAPAVNLQRNPLGGRNFEYFSEDPLLTGTAGVFLTRGVQENHPVMVCPKHFAANEQETFRRGSSRRSVDAVDTIAQEKALRELYLKPFRMLTDAGVMYLMSSFNKINGTFAAANSDLCTGILRDEWGFTGVVVTDWGDMDIVADGADAVAAGNDVIMPGGPPVITQILQGLEQGRVTRHQLEKAVEHLLSAIG